MLNELDLQKEADMAQACLISPFVDRMRQKIGSFYNEPQVFV